MMTPRRIRGTALVEPLEARALFAAAPVLPLAINEIPQADGSTQLEIFNSFRKARITLAQASTGLVVGSNGGWTQTVPGSFSSIVIYAGAGHDSVAIDPSVTTNCLIHGGPCDTLSGGSGNDSIYSGTGRSIITAGSGDDTIVTISGRNDLVYGGSGFDNFWAGPTDLLMNVSQNETNAGTVHRIASFLNYRSPGGRMVRMPMTLRGQTFPEPLAPAAVGYAGTQGYPLFGSSGASPSDIQQQAAGDCYFLSTLASIANVDPAAMPQSIASLGDGTYVVEFFRNGWPVYVREDGNVPVDSSGVVVYGNLGPDNSTWVALMEKAYAIFRTGTADYSTLDGGLPAEVYGSLDFAYTDTNSPPASEADFVQMLMSDEQAGLTAVYATNSAPTDPQLVPDHAYMVNGVVTDSVGTPVAVQLRNPWGTDVQGDSTYDGYIDISLADAYASMMDYCSAAV
jgi:Ca2+-binding RTX toxin-like protein